MLHQEPLPQFEPQEEYIGLASCRRHIPVGILKDNIIKKGIVLLPPDKVERLIREKITVLIERGFGIHASYKDIDYADVGADVVDNATAVIQHANTILKLEPLSLSDLQALKPRQVIVSSLDLFNIPHSYFSILKEKEITAFDLDLIQDMEGNSVLNQIFYQEESPADITSMLGLFVVPLITAIALSSNLRSSIQTNPALFQGIYCYNGNIVRKEIADKFGLPWTDFLSLYWNLN